MFIQADGKVSDDVPMLRARHGVARRGCFETGEDEGGEFGGDAGVGVAEGEDVFWVGEGA